MLPMSRGRLAASRRRRRRRRQGCRGFAGKRSSKEIPERRKIFRHCIQRRGVGVGFVSITASNSCFILVFNTFFVKGNAVSVDFLLVFFAIDPISLALAEKDLYKFIPHIFSVPFS